jgi:SH3-like domain-containing protein
LPWSAADEQKDRGLLIRGLGLLCWAMLVGWAMLAGDLARAATDLPLPRYASLRADQVNLRTGPGVRYPVDWVFVRRDLPVEIVAEFDTWRKVRDWQGTEGWVHQSMLSGRRTVIVVNGTRALRARPQADAPLVARVEERVVGRLMRCEGGWCRVEFSGIRGWLPRGQFWGGRRPK